MNIKELSVQFIVPEDEIEELDRLAENPRMVKEALLLLIKAGGYNFKFAKRIIKSLNAYYNLALENGVDLYKVKEEENA